MTKLELPYVKAYRDRHGKWRYYFRRRGYAKVKLPGAPGTLEFMAAYQAAVSGESAPKVEIGATKTKPGTFGKLVVDYYASSDFKKLSDATKATYRGIIERLRGDHKDRLVADLQRKHIAAMLSKIAETPAAHNNRLRMFRMLMRFAISEGLRKDDPTLGMRTIRIKSGGFHTWTEEEVAAYEARHPVGTKARLALALLIYTAQRRSDVVRMGRQHVRSGAIHIRQQKTGTEVDIPIHAELQAILDATPSDHLTFLVTEFGKPFTVAGFGNWLRDRCREAGLEGCSAHGLRKAACVRLADAGASTHEIMAISGHLTLKEVEKYTREANRRRLARAAIAKISGTPSV